MIMTVKVKWSRVMHQGIKSFKSQSFTLKLGNLFGCIKFQFLLSSGFLVRAFVRNFEFCITDYAVAGACSLSSDLCWTKVNSPAVNDDGCMAFCPTLASTGEPFSACFQVASVISRRSWRSGPCDIKNHATWTWCSHRFLEQAASKCLYISVHSMGQAFDAKPSTSQTGYSTKVYKVYLVVASWEAFLKPQGTDPELARFSLLFKNCVLEPGPPAYLLELATWFSLRKVAETITSYYRTYYDLWAVVSTLAAKLPYASLCLILILPYAASMTPMTNDTCFDFFRHFPGCFLPPSGQGGHFLCLRSIGLPAEEFAIGFGPEVVPRTMVGACRSSQAEHGKDVACTYNMCKDVIKSYRIHNFEAAIMAIMF